MHVCSDFSRFLTVHPYAGDLILLALLVGVGFLLAAIFK